MSKSPKVNERYFAEISWYDRKSMRNQTSYRTLQLYSEWSAAPVCRCGPPSQRTRAGSSFFSLTVVSHNVFFREIKASTLFTNRPSLSWLSLYSWMPASKKWISFFNVSHVVR